MPIIEPEVDIKTPNKDKAEELLKASILKELDALKPDQPVMLKLTIPEKDNLYADLIKHKNVLRVVALSGGYSREESNKRLARNNGMTASFSRALSEGLTAQQSDAEFNAALDVSVESIYRASITCRALSKQLPFLDWLLAGSATARIGLRMSSSPVVRRVYAAANCFRLAGQTKA